MINDAVYLACPYSDCPCIFLAPAARLHHLEHVHGEKHDPVSAKHAVQQLHELLQRLARREAKAL